MDIQPGFNELQLVYVCMLIGVGLIIFMFTKISKQEDERRKVIIEKSSTITFICYISVILVDLLLKFVNISPIFDESSSFLHLSLISVLFSINLLITNKKFGDYDGE